MEEFMKKRDNSIDSVKGIMIICVLLSHIALDATYDNKFYFSIFSYFINMFQMPVFIFISGYFSKNLEKAKARGKTLFIQFIPFHAFWYVFSVIIGDDRFYNNWMVPGYALWYILTLAVLRYVLADITKIRYILPVSFVLGVAICAVNVSYTNMFALPKIISSLPFFLLGYYCTEENFNKIKKLRPWIAVAILAFTLGLSFVLNYSGVFHEGSIQHFLSFRDYFEDVEDSVRGVAFQAMIAILYTIGIYVINILSGVAVISLVSKIKSRFISERLGKNTFSIYILANYFQFAFCSLLRNGIKFQSDTLNLLVALVEILLVLLICSNKHVVKCFNKLTNKFVKLIVK